MSRPLITRTRSSLLALAVLIPSLLIAGASSAGVLALDEPTTLSLEVGSLPGLETDGIGLPLPVSVANDGSFELPPTVFSTVSVLPPGLFTGVSIISSLTLSAANATGNFSPGAGLQGGYGGPMQISGSAIIGLFGGLVNLNIPLSVAGAGGTVMAQTAGIMVTVTGHIWTTGSASVTGITTTPVDGGPVLNTVTRTGTYALDPDTGGTVTLVTPVRVLTNVAGNLPTFVTTRLNFVPEPGTLMLFGMGLAGVAGWRSRKRSRS